MWFRRPTRFKVAYLMVDSTTSRSLPDVRNLSDKIRFGIYHTPDHELARRHMDHLCGKVRKKQDALIRRSVVGRRVLGVGFGYGNLSRHLANHGFDIEPPEPFAETCELARQSWRNLLVADNLAVTPPRLERAR